MTGVAGFIGSTLAEALVSAGHEVVGIDCFTDYYDRGRKLDNLRIIGSSELFRFHELDLRTDALDEALQGAEAIINEAATPGLARSWSHFDDYLSCNVRAVHRLLEAAKRAKVQRFVQASTSSVYGGLGVGTEQLATAPISPYGVTKLAAENLLLAHHAAFDFPVIILRYFSIYGPRQRPDMAYHRFIDRLLLDEPLTIYGDGSQSRSNTYVEDAVAGTIQALHKGSPGEIYNIGGGESVTLLEAVQMLAGALNKVPRLQYEPRRPGDQWHTAADCSKAEKAFGYRPAVGAAVGLQQQIQWHLDNDRLRSRKGSSSIG